MIIGISGFAGVGKDSLAAAFEDRGCIIVSLADPLKRIVMEIFGFDPNDLWGPSENRNRPYKQYPNPNAPSGYLTPRYALQMLGTEYARQCYPDIWTDYALRIARKLRLPPVLVPNTQEYELYVYSRMKGLGVQRFPLPVQHTPWEAVVIPDCRFKNEFRLVREEGGHLIRVTRPGFEEPAYDHPSETEQAEVPDDYFDAICSNALDLEILCARAPELLEGFQRARLEAPKTTEGYLVHTKQP